MELIISCIWSLLFPSFAAISLGVGLSPVSQIYVWLFCHIKREGLEHFVVTLYLVKIKRHKFGGVQWQLCSEWCFLWAELGFDKKSISAGTFSHGVLGARDVSYPLHLNLEHIISN